MANSSIHRELADEVAALINELKGVSIKSKRQTARILNKAVKPLVMALFVAAPTSSKTHYRYQRHGLKGTRASKGKGIKVAAYKPGNLAGSFQVLRFRNAKYSVVVGPKIAKGYNNTGTYNATRSDGYYAHMVERGTKHSAARPFVGPTWIRMREPVRYWIIEDLKKTIKRAKK